jgi:hypothetical protein
VSVDELETAGIEVFPLAPKPPLAKRIRDFFETLFPDKLVLQLRADLDETRKQRDYFKGRAERLELLLTQPRVANRDLSDPVVAGQRRPTQTHAGGRKLWPQIVAERRQQLAEAAVRAAGEKPKPTSAPATPTPPAQN